MPIEIIEEIIDGSEVRPEKGKLWCLGVEGIAKKDYELLIDKWNKIQDITFVYPQTINMSKHINALFYFFQTIGNKLAVVYCRSASPVSNNHLRISHIIIFEKCSSKSNDFVMKRF